MNSRHHGDLTLVACHLDGIPRAQAEPLIQGAEKADYVDDVACSIPFRDEFPGTWSALCHFQRPDGSGYYWDADRSLGALEDLGDLALHVARAPVLGSSLPMRAACAAQPSAGLSDFRFPSAAQMGSHWSTFPAFSEEAGRALHMLQDACLPHHVWGCLLWGHQEFEDALEGLWFQHREMLHLAGDSKAAAADFIMAVRVECIAASTVESLIKENAAWALRWFGQMVRREECAITDCLAICVRAVASTMRAIDIMTGGSHARVRPVEAA